MKRFTRPLVLTALVFVAGTSIPGDYAYAQTTSVVVVQPGPRVYTYPEGRYELRGEGTATSPYYWVWIPAGVQSVPVAPPLPSVIVQPSQPVYALPPLPTVVQPGPRLYTYPEGRYELRGEGTASSPYYWVWIPTGVQSIPPSPPLPSVIVQPSQRVYAYPEGQYELRGEGTTSSPFYWVWIPTATVSQTPAPRYQYQADLRSAEGRISYFDPWARTMTFYGGKTFVLPQSIAMTSPLGIGEQVVVTYYVAQDGRNVVRAIDHSAAQ